MPGSRSLSYLARIPLFASCTTKELKAVAKAADEVAVEAGRVLITEGGTGHEAYVVIDGEATVRRNGRKLAALGPGDHFGELALLDGGPRSATVTADTAMTLLVLRQGELLSLLEEIPQLSRKVMANLAGQIRDLDRKIYA